jgi:hypothetical protein
MFRATPLRTKTSLGHGSSINEIPNDTDTDTDSVSTMPPSESKDFSSSRRDRDPRGVTRDRFVEIRDTVSRNSAEAAAASAQRDEMRRSRALGSEYSWHHQSFELAVDDKLPKKAGLLLLGRTPSGCDYAQNMGEEDDVTFVSDTSSYCAMPSRMQMIHRPIHKPMPALFQDEDRDTSDLTDADRNTDWPQVGPSPPATVVRDDSRDESPKPQTRSSDVYQRDDLTRGNEQQNNVSYQFQTDTSQDGRVVLIPRVESFNLSYEKDWLELEPDNSTPDASCFCMGYSILDFLVPDTTAASRRRNRSRANKHRLPRSKILLNTVEEAAEEGGADVFPYISTGLTRTRVAPARSKSPNSVSSPKLKYKKDPVGDYDDPVEIYSSII